MEYIPRFDKHSTALQVLHNSDLKGKVYLVTGSSRGIGFETVRALALHGATVIISGSSENTTKQAVKKLLSQQPDASVHHYAIDLSSLQKVRTVAKKILQDFKRLDGLVLNAGLQLYTPEVTEDGLDLTYQVNFISQFYLTLLLSDALQEGSRVIIVTSLMYIKSAITRETLIEYLKNPVKDGWRYFYRVYSNSKLFNTLHAHELSRRLEPKGVLVFSVHPGLVMTDIISWSSYIYFKLFESKNIKTTEQGASGTVYGCISQDIVKYTGKLVVNAHLKMKELSPAANDEKMAEELWEYTEELLHKKGFLPIGN